MLDSIGAKKHVYQTPTPRKKSKTRIVVAAIMFVLLAAGIFIGSKLVIFAQKIFEGSHFSFTRFFITDDKPISGEEGSEIRILVMGIGGAAHDGGTLTDTLMLATIKLPDTEQGKVQVSLFSIPRDLPVDIPGVGPGKINSAYAYGEAGGKNNGPETAVQTVEKLIGQDIPYYIVLDFRGFQKIIDDLGGIKVNVESSFTDSQYPDAKSGFLPPVTFEKGLQEMDGERALQFVRSRHGTNDEGSDFARTRRQHLVLKSIKDEVKSARILTSLGLMDRLLQDLSEHLRTNIEPHVAKRIYDLTKKIEEKNIYSQSLDQTGLICDYIEESSGAYYVIPCSGINNYEGIRNFLKNQFLDGALTAEQPVIEIQNASAIEQLGRKVSDQIYLPHLAITVSNYRGAASYTSSIIYDNTKGQKTETLYYLQKTLGIKLASSPFPFPTSSDNPDFVIIVTGDPKDR